MSQSECMYFDISKITEVKNISDLKNISDYLDFAIKATIHNQMPNVTEEQEKELAAAILKDFMNGEENVFTRKYGIRNSIKRIGQESIKNLLLKTILEKDSRRLLSQRPPKNHIEECASYVTCSVYYQFETNNNWLNCNIPTFIDAYVEDSYGKTPSEKHQMEQLSYENDMTTKALEYLDKNLNKRKVILLSKIA